MKNYFITTMFVLFAATLSLHAEGTPKSLTIMLDGARADVMLMATTPNFDSICNGSWAEGYRGAWSLAAHTIKDAPTISGPNHAAIATGVTAGKTQVPNNDLYKNYNEKKVSETYQTFLTHIKKRHPDKRTVFLYEWKPDIILVSENNPCDLALQGADKIHALRIPTILDGSFETANWKKGADVDAILWYIDKPDKVGHSGGYCPPGLKHDDYIKTIEEIDGWTGEILDTIKKRPNFAQEDWLIVVTSDHGGWISGHGSMRSENYTIPLMISGKNVVQGEIQGQPCCADAAVTVLDHFGIDVAKMKKEGLLDGSVRGKNETVSVSGKTLDDGLLVYLPFDGSLENKVKVPKNSESIIAENRGATIKPNGGKQNGYLEIRKNKQPQFVTLGNQKSLQFETDGNFSVAFWTRMPNIQEEEPVFIGNKDWLSGQNPGFCFFANPLSANNGNIIGFNIADNNRLRVDVKQIFVSLNTWWFCAVTVDRKNNATIFSGGPDGRLFFCSESLTDENLGKSFGRLHGSIDTPLSWNIGQDGTGKCKSQLNADIDELRIWNRALNLKEIELLFKNTK
ncbi:MAG: alkaline phosphatase family protein [Planctomycetaceae bacterium]|nr:alkaline phosphatase family protein [Planctomycetaceae bacterium]